MGRMTVAVKQIKLQHLKPLKQKLWNLNFEMLLFFKLMLYYEANLYVAIDAVQLIV